jgi:hypothetical protein
LSKLGSVLGGGQGLKKYAGQVITIRAFEVEEDERGNESVAILADNGDSAVHIRTTSSVVIRQLHDLQAEDLLPATVQVDEVRSGSGRTYLSLSEPAD